MNKKIWSYLAALQSVITLFLYHIFTLVSTSQTTGGDVHSNTRINTPGGP